MLRMKAFPQAGHCSRTATRPWGVGRWSPTPLGCGPPLIPRRGRQHLGDEMLVDGAPACRLGLYVPAVTKRELSQDLPIPVPVKFRDTTLEQRR